jgi:molybdopterin synthase sulfur carrier subunit
MEGFNLTCVVFLPAPLRDSAGGQSSLEAQGETVGAVLRDLGRICKPLQDKICGPDGDLKSSVNVYVNEKDIRRLDGLDTAVKDGDEVFLVPAIAGG